jgi:hypothetical protein
MAIERFCLLIGAMKCGTTTLFKSLIQHPALAGAREKEPNFFTRAELRDRGRGWYESFWDHDPARHAWALEASTEYAKLPVCPSAAAFLRRVPADYRILYVVRDPLERLRSHYRHGLAQGFVQQPIHELLAPDAVAFGNYHLQLWPYVLALGREKILALDHRELLADMPAVLRRATAFLGLDPGFRFQPVTRQNTGGYHDQRALAHMLTARGLLPDLVSEEALARLPAAEFQARCRGWAREAGRPEGWAETVSAHQRACTPTRAQAAEVRALLRDDLDRFRDDWGIDPWSEENRAALGERALVA